jgi:alkylation response protein AidB-like acyl-CoA dehydrogenase
MNDHRDPVEFERHVRSFFDGRVPKAPTRTGWGHGPDAVVSAGLAPGRDGPEIIDAARAFQRELFDAGLAWLTGPRDYGGAELGADHARAFRAIAAEYAAPDTSCLLIGQHIVAPAVAAYGSDEQKRRWLRGLFRGDVIGCQMFSEPDAGSDLASLRTRAVRDGEGWCITGQKVWSSGAHHADVGEVLVRTEDDPSLRHAGLTMFLVEMTSPGVTVKPLRQMNGNAHFNEVFLQDVFVPADAMLGPRSGGWAVANASLTRERDIPIDELGLFLDPSGRFIEMARQLGFDGDARHRQRIAAAYTDRFVARQLPSHLATASRAVAAIAPSLVKLHTSTTLWQLAQSASSLCGAGLTADAGDWGRYAWTGMVLGVHSQRIAGGTDEIQHNIIGERGLGLPREPKQTSDRPTPR